MQITKLLFTIFSVQKLVNQSFSVHTTEDVKKTDKSTFTKGMTGLGEGEGVKLKYLRKPR